VNQPLIHGTERTRLLIEYEKLQDPALAEEVYAKYDNDLKNFSPLDPIKVPDGMVNQFVADAAGMPVLPHNRSSSRCCNQKPRSRSDCSSRCWGADFGILAGVGKHEEAYKKAIMEGKSKKKQEILLTGHQPLHRLLVLHLGVGMAFVPGAKLSPDNEKRWHHTSR